MNDELERILEGIGHSLIEVLAGHFPEGTEQNLEKYPTGHAVFHPRFNTSAERRR